MKLKQGSCSRTTMFENFLKYLSLLRDAQNLIFLSNGLNFIDDENFDVSLI